MSDEPAPPRVVRPRREVEPQRLPIIAASIEDGSVFVERTGEIYPLGTLPAILRAEPSGIIAVMNAARMLAGLDRIFDADPAWQYRVSPDKRTIQHPNGYTTGRRVTGTVVHFLGFRPPDKSKKKGHYHYPLDPMVFTRRSVHELIDGDDPRVIKLYRWAASIREWTEGQKLRISPTQGGLAGQLLRDRRFFPDDRRKVPKATNARIRPTLPGNFYRLYADEGRAHQAYYLDMKSAHHNIAAQLAFPDPNTLYARGHFRVTDDAVVTVHSSRPYARNGTALFNRLTTQAHGLLYVCLSVPILRGKHFPPPYLERPGRRMAWVYTNELPTLRTLGVSIDWVTAAWVSFDTCNGLNRYAEYAMRELAANNAETGRWLKPALLSTYGILAARPRVREFAFRQAKGGIPKQYPAGSAMLRCMAMVSDEEHEVPIANVLYRGMIEAEQRKQALDLARDLHARKHKIIAVYADSVFVDSSKPLPFLPEPWVIQEQLDRLQFWHPTAFTSVQATKLPGIPTEAAQRAAMILRMRGMNTPHL